MMKMLILFAILFVFLATSLLCFFKCFKYIKLQKISLVQKVIHFFFISVLATFFSVNFYNLVMVRDCEYLFNYYFVISILYTFYIILIFSLKRDKSKIIDLFFYGLSTFFIFFVLFNSFIKRTNYSYRLPVLEVIFGAAFIYFIRFLYHLIKTEKSSFILMHLVFLALNQNLLILIYRLILGSANA